MERMQGFRPINGMRSMADAEAEMMPTIQRGETLPEGVRAVIGKEEIRKALSELQKYKDGKAALDERIRGNEEWYRLRHWGEVGRSRNPGDPEPTSAWLLNALMNKHADAMDNYPEASVLPREAMDKEAAKALSEVMPTLLEQTGYEDVYSRKWWKKLKGGTGCTAVVWNPRALNGLGDVEIKVIDLLNVFWEPGVEDIQDSANFFRVDIADNEALERQYPQLKGKLGGDDISTVKYYYDDHIDTSEKTPVVDWYYKRELPGGKTVTHYVKFAADEVLFASENDPYLAETGYYQHGKYPFVMDVMFPIAGSPAGFGFLDICKDPQLFIDKLNQIMLKSGAEARPRYFVRADGALNEKEFADLKNDFVHYQGSQNPKDSIMPIEPPAMPGYIMTLLEYKVNELKETSGNTDFGQGVSTAGVTAASAIAALQEAGGKLSRDMLKTSYRAFTEECYLIIELIRQFYDVARVFRITGEQGEEEFVTLDNSMLGPQPMGMEYGVDLGSREPVFDIKVRAYKANSFSRLSQNELAKEFYGAGFFNPQLADQALACLSMMDFEGKDEVERKIAANGTMYQTMMLMQQRIMQLEAAMGIAPAAGEAQPAEGAAPQPSMTQGSRGGSSTNAVRDAVKDIGNPSR